MEEKIDVLCVAVDSPARRITINNDLYALQGVVGGDIECVNFWPSRNVVLICNEEGKINDVCEPNRRIYDESDTYRDTIYGAFLLVGYDKDGNFTSISDEDAAYFSTLFE